MQYPLHPMLNIKNINLVYLWKPNIWVIHYNKVYKKVKNNVSQYSDTVQSLCN